MLLITNMFLSLLVFLAILLYFSSAFGLAYWNHNKGNSFWFTLLLSIFLTPLIGALFVSFSKVDEEKYWARQVKRHRAKYCEICNQIIEFDTLICPYCNPEPEYDESEFS